MAGINDMITRLESLDFDSQVTIAIQETDFQLIQLVQEQMHDGYLSTGEDIAPAYANKYYARKKAAQNPSARGNPDAYLTGQFYKDIFIELDKDEYTLKSSVEYAEDLIEHYGENLLRASPKSKSLYGAQYLRPKLIDYVTTKLRV